MIIILILSFALIISISIVLFYKREIRLLNQTLNTMKHTDTNMRLTTITFDKDICLLSNIINDILDKQKAVIISSEKSNREFRQAITNISHDLRTPLTSAIGYIQMIKSDKIPENKKIEYLNIIEYRLKSLSSLMNELFDYTQIIEGKTNINIEKLNICNFMCDIISSFYDDFIEKNFTVEIDIPDTPVYVFCDIPCLKRVVQNLIQNALIHGTGQFLLIIHSKDNEITFQNKVPNIQELEVERLFERFYTSDLSRSGKTTGLGLAISKELVINMGGTINASIKQNLLNVCIRLPSTTHHL